MHRNIRTLMKDYYFILGVTSTAGSNEIKLAFRKLCFKYHPDRTITYDHERYSDICEAYRVLSNKSKREVYDKKLFNDPNHDLSNLRAGIYPEIKTSYKGIYPWFAAFAVIIVATIALIFNFSTEQSAYTNNEKALVPVTPKTVATPPASPPAPAQAPTPLDTLKQAPAIVVENINAPDTLTKRDELAHFITSTLAQNTSRSKAKASERNHQYSFKGDKLLVVYDIGPKGHVIKKQVAIPVKDITSIYYYAGQLWITNPKKSIYIYDLKSGKRSRSDFFAVRFDTSKDKDLEHKLADAFSQLKTL